MSFMFIFLASLFAALAFYVVAWCLSKAIFSCGAYTPLYMHTSDVFGTFAFMCAIVAAFAMLHTDVCAASMRGCNATPAHCVPIAALPMRVDDDNACRVLIADITLPTVSPVGDRFYAWLGDALTCPIEWRGRDGVLLLNDHVVRYVGGEEMSLDDLICAETRQWVGVTCFTREYQYSLTIVPDPVYVVE